jgi:hypothetical protein
VTPPSAHFEEDAWLLQVLYLTGIFSELSDLNLVFKEVEITYFQWKINCTPFIGYCFYGKDEWKPEIWQHLLH